MNKQDYLSGKVSSTTESLNIPREGDEVMIDGIAHVVIRISGDTVELEHIFEFTRITMPLTKVAKLPRGDI